MALGAHITFSILPCVFKGLIHSLGVLFEWSWALKTSFLCFPWGWGCCDLAPHMLHGMSSWNEHSLITVEYVVHVVNVAKVRIDVVVVYLSKQ
jgi:hypothetical protein